MAIVGIVGGLGPESTIDYYRRILDAWSRVDASTAPSIVIDSLDVQRALRLVAHDLPGLAEYLLASLRRLAGAGADFAAMSANTPHIVFDDLAARSPIPLVSIVEVCADEARQRGLTRLALLGTRFTMEAPFYPAVFARNGMTIVRPNDEDRAWVHQRYVDELLKGEFRDDTREQFIGLVHRLRDGQQVEAAILGGTELPLLLSTPLIAGVPALDTTELHVAAIVRRLRQPTFDLNRFVQAQERDYQQALAEIRSGRKRSHWMWYIFPQYDGLGFSATSRRYAIKSLDEARAYLAHPVLGPRLRECAEAAIGVAGASASEVFGSPDDLKLRSCATLFAAVSPPGSVFEALLDRYFGGSRDEKTLGLVRAADT